MALSTFQGCTNRSVKVRLVQSDSDLKRRCLRETCLKSGIGSWKSLESLTKGRKRPLPCRKTSSKERSSGEDKKMWTNSVLCLSTISLKRNKVLHLLYLVRMNNPKLRAESRFSLIQGKQESQFKKEKQESSSQYCRIDSK